MILDGILAGVRIFYTAFKEACGPDFDYLDNSKFYYVIVLLAKALFGHEDNPFETGAAWDELLKLIEQPERSKRLVDAFYPIHESLRRDASRKVADTVFEMVGRHEALV